MIPLIIRLLPDWAPNVHPVLVHFPIAIFFFAAGMDLLSFVLPKEWWGERKTAITYFIGAIFVVIVFYTGKQAAGSLDIPKYAYGAVGAHAGWAHYTVWFFGIYGVVRLILSFIRRIRGLSLHIVMFLISLIGLYFLFETGEHGAKLVFGYGLGTGQLAQDQPAQMIEPDAPGFHMSDDTADWVIGKNATHALAEHFTFLKGDTTAMQAQAVEKGKKGYELTMRSPHFFFVMDNNTYGDVQIELAVQPGNYKGDIVITHNVHDAENYAYMALHPDGTAALGRYVNGKNTIIEKGTFDPNGLSDIKMGISGRHIHGYVNGKGILHGHSDQTGPGAVGLKLDGEGTFTLRSFKISKITGEDAGHDGDEHKS